MGFIHRIFGKNAKARTLLWKLPIRDKESTVKEVQAWDSGWAVDPVRVVKTDEAARILGDGLLNRMLHGHWVSCEPDRIVRGYANPFGSQESTTTILRVGKDEFILHRCAKE
ncbi:MAG: hypothetical protein HYU86_06130 [Chloroflexi bacterium]|nr:hypothetical protein [Chloroflexota bacterium]